MESRLEKFISERYYIQNMKYEVCGLPFSYCPDELLRWRCVKCIAFKDNWAYLAPILTEGLIENE